MSRDLSQLTIRGFAPELAARIRALAERQGISLNKAVLLLLRQGAGLSDPEADSGAVGHALDRFVGTWTQQQAEELDATVEEAFGQVDPEMWR